MAYLIRIKEARPVLSWKYTKAGFGYYVKHWEVEGSTYDADCLCNQQDFKEIVILNKLEVSKLELKALLVDKIKRS